MYNSVEKVGIIYSSTNPRSITMYVLLPNENIAHASTLGRRTGIHVLFGWGGSAHLAPFVGQCGMYTQCGG